MPDIKKTNPRATVEVRAAVAQDAAGIARIYNQHVDLGESTFDEQHWSDQRVMKLLEFGSPDAWFVAVESDHIVGWASARRYSLRLGYRFTCETAVYLEPRAVGGDVGSALQARIESHCRDCGIHHAVAKIIVGNERSMAFHRKFGYELVGVQKEVGHMNGRWLDVAIFQRVF